MGLYLRRVNATIQIKHTSLEIAKKQKGVQFDQFKRTQGSKITKLNLTI